MFVEAKDLTGACEPIADLFAKEWPDGVEITVPNLRRAVEIGLPVTWLGLRLPGTNQRRAVLEAIRNADHARETAMRASGVIGTGNDWSTRGRIKRAKRLRLRPDPPPSAEVVAERKQIEQQADIEWTNVILRDIEAATKLS